MFYIIVNITFLNLNTLKGEDKPAGALRTCDFWTLYKLKDELIVQKHNQQKNR